MFKNTKVVMIRNNIKLEFKLIRMILNNEYT